MISVRIGLIPNGIVVPLAIVIELADPAVQFRLKVILLKVIPEASIE